METTNINFRPVAAAEIEQLERAPWSSGLKEKHRLRHQRQQEGAAVYLVAWRGPDPIGHLFLKWSGPHDPLVASRIADCAEIEDFVILPELRSRGIGRRMLDTAAALTRERGMARLGLAVGLDNPRARALYERNGFVDSGFGELPLRWQYQGEDGKPRWHEETAVYLVKELA